MIEIVVKMKFLSTFLKFSFSKWFGEEVSRLICRGYEFNPDCVVFNLLSSKVKINLKVLGLLMKNRVITQFDTTVIVTEKKGGFVV